MLLLQYVPKNCTITDHFLNCSRCNCSELPGGINQTVTNLDISWNSFSMVSTLILIETLSEIAGNLTHLTLASSITDYDLDMGEFSLLKHLTDLDISYADIWAIKNCMNDNKELSSILKFNISHITTHFSWIISANFFPVNLRELVLNGNNIVQVDQTTFSNLHQLEKALLSDCSLFYFEMQLFPTTLTYLDMSYSKNWTGENKNMAVFSNLRNLKTLNLS